MALHSLMLLLMAWTPQSAGNFIADEKDEIKYDMDHLNEAFGIKLKSAKVAPSETTGETLIIMTLEFTRSGFEDQKRLATVFSGKPDPVGISGGSLRCYFLDEDGVVIGKQLPGKIDGVLTGKKDDAFRITQAVPTNILAKIKKVAFRWEMNK